VAERQRLPLLQLLAEQTDIGTFDAQPVAVCVGDGRFGLPSFPARGGGWQAAMEELVEVLPQQLSELIVRRGILINPADQRAIGVAERGKERFNSVKLLRLLFPLRIANTDHRFFGSPIDQHVRLRHPR